MNRYEITGPWHGEGMSLCYIIDRHDDDKVLGTIDQTGEITTPDPCGSRKCSECEIGGCTGDLS